MTPMHICIECKHHRKEGRAGIRCWAGVVESVVRDPVTGATKKLRNFEPVNCYARRRVHTETCPDYLA